VVESFNPDIDKINEYFATLEVVEVSLNADTESEVKKCEKSLKHDSAIINNAIKMALTSPSGSPEKSIYLEHAHKGLYGILENIWVQAVGNSITDDKRVQHFRYLLSVDDLTNLLCEAHVITYNFGKIILVSTGIAFNEKMGRNDYILYYPLIIFVGDGNIDNDLINVGRARLDKVYEIVNKDDVVGTLIAFDKAMKVSIYS